MKTDILIVGSGCSGLYCALNLPREKQITIITKSAVILILHREESVCLRMTVIMTVILRIR